MEKLKEYIKNVPGPSSLFGTLGIGLVGLLFAFKKSKVNKVL